MDEAPGCWNVVFWLCVSVIALQVTFGFGPWGKLLTP